MEQQDLHPPRQRLLPSPPPPRHSLPSAATAYLLGDGFPDVCNQDSRHSHGPVLMAEGLDSSRTSSFFSQIHPHGFFPGPSSPYDCASMLHGLRQAERRMAEMISAPMLYDAKRRLLLPSQDPLPVPMQIQIPHSVAQMNPLGTRMMPPIHPPAIALPTAQIVRSMPSRALFDSYGNATANSPFPSPSPSPHSSPGFCALLLHHHHHHHHHRSTYPGNHHLRREGFGVGAMVEKRKREPADREALMKETWDLHCLFRAARTEDDAAASKAMASQECIEIDSVWNEGSCKRNKTDCWHDYFANKMKDATVKESGNESRNDDFEKDCEQIEACKALAKSKNGGEIISYQNSFQGTEATTLKEEEGEDEEEKGAKKAPEPKKCVQTAAREKLAELMCNSSDGDGNSDGESERGFCSDSEDEEEPCPSSPRSVKKGKEEMAYDLFLKLFDEDHGLTKLYEEQCHVGKFECLVCSTIKGKAIKMFNGLTSIVHHAMKIQKTKRRPEHRGFGRAICTILGWQRERLPSSAESKNLSPRGCLPEDA